MKIPVTLLLNYQIEFETSDITIEQLCEKYDVTTKQLKGYTKWSKSKRLPQPTETTNIVNSNSNNDNSSEEVLADIKEFKSLAMQHALKFMKNDAQFAEVKEFKDIVAIVDSIEKSYKDTKDTGPTVNVLVQNITERFKDDV